jgi:lipopolysaccharide export system ATP-binding protein
MGFFSKLFHRNKSRTVHQSEAAMRRVVIGKEVSNASESDAVDTSLSGEENLLSLSSNTYDSPNVVSISSRDKSKPHVSDDGHISHVPKAGRKLGLQIENLGKSYSGRPVVRGVNLSIKRGEAVGLLGPNGAGKTSTFYMIMGLIKPDYGIVRLDGQDITNFPVYQRARMGVGYLPQEASIFRGLSVEDNIMAALEVAEPIKDKQKTMLDSLLAEFSITHLRRTPSIALSGGERRRVEIARALASNPSFILLDEPLAGIDPVAVSDIKELIGQLKERGIGVLITDHNVREALDLIDRAVIVYEGKVLVDGKPEDIVSDNEVRRVYLGEGFKW